MTGFYPKIHDVLTIEQRDESCQRKEGPERNRFIPLMPA
jgi:hypothetical protein